MSSTISLAVDPRICRSIAIGWEGVDINGAFLKIWKTGSTSWFYGKSTLVNRGRVSTSAGCLATKEHLLRIRHPSDTLGKTNPRATFLFGWKGAACDDNDLPWPALWVPIAGDLPAGCGRHRKDSRLEGRLTKGDPWLRPYALSLSSDRVDTRTGEIFLGK